jgi:hypothetical protein
MRREFLTAKILLGRELRSDKAVLAEEVLSSDRTIRNEIHRMAAQERKGLTRQLIDAAQAGALCLSPDIWTDNYRQVSYLGATAHYVDDHYRFHSIDLFCIEFKAKKKTAEEILRVRNSCECHSEADPTFIYPGYSGTTEDLRSIGTY